MKKSADMNRIIDVTKNNIAEHSQAVCFINPGHEHFQHKVGWLLQQSKTGLKIKLLYPAGEKRAAGYIEFVPGEHCWRGVRAKGYMFIHCLWTTGKPRQHKGLGGQLIRVVEAEAKGMLGVCVLTSDRAFMARQDIFIKHGYRIVDASGSEQLLVKQFKTGPLPGLRRPRQQKGRGLSIFYSKQCPWVARFVEEVKPILKKLNLPLSLTELKTAAQAQNAPCVYGVFNLLYDGRVLADRYISMTRFLNILKKEKIARTRIPGRKGIK
ncbi:MAG: YoaP domain-containing protein [Candidatus Aminicenantes bacterium]|nr:YoaP domain-containing protein [Candidatus Aminicenantes bacterium]